MSLKKFIIIKKSLVVVFLFFNFIIGYGQCPYTGTPLTSVGTYAFCIDNPTTNTLTTTSVNAGQYALVDVVKGFKYTFSVGNVFTSGTENLTILEADSNTNVSPTAYVSGASGATINNWISTISGQIKVLLSKDACINDGSTGGVLTLQLMSVGNTQDSQTTFGTDNWVGHVYNNNYFSSTGSSPASPLPATLPFTDANYVGYYTIASETINENFGGATACFPVFTAGVQRTTLYTEVFSVRYRMKSTRVAGCYFLNVGGDDGVRVYVDGVLVSNQWFPQSYKNYCNNLIYLNGNSEIILDYYENSGNNTVTFSLTKFDNSTNVISGVSKKEVCLGTPLLLEGAYDGCAGGSNTNYQWESSIDGITFTDISGAIGKNYSTPSTCASVVGKLYYRRSMESSASNAAACGKYYTPAVEVTTTDCGKFSKPIFNSSVTTPCASTTNLIYKVDNINNATTYNWTVPTGWSITSGDNTNSIKVTAGSFGQNGNITVQAKNGCSTYDSEITTLAVTVTALPATPVVGTITQPSCVITKGIVALSGLPSSGTWTITASPVTTGLTGMSGTGENTLISGLTPNTTYTFKVSNGTCSSVASANVVIAPLPLVATYNLGWTNGPPTSLQSIVFDSTYNSTGDLVGCDCKINSGIVTIKSGHTLTLTNGLDVVAGGSLTFENNASLVQVNNTATNLGVINYKRQTAAVKRYDFTYWSSPVQGQTLKNLSPNTLGDKYYSYDGNNWVISYDGVATMLPGYGYAIRAPQSFSSTAAVIDTAPMFTGKPNNGTINLTLQPDKTYLLGNPYPSALDADTFLNDNATVLKGTLYFWTHNTSPSSTISGTGIYNYSSNDYASYNKTGGVGGVKAISESRGDTYKPSGKIAAGQGFFAERNATVGSVVFNNGMRATGNNTQFFRTKSNSKTKGLFEKNRVWLNLYNNQGAFKQTLLGYITGASNAYDNGYDGESFDGNDYIDFYSINQNKNLVIQGRELPFDENDTVPLGYRSTIVGTFTIEIDQTDGSLESQNIYIEDKMLNVVHNLKITSYSFTTKAGTFDNRFVLRYTDRTLGTTDFETLESQVLILKVKGKLNIKSVKETIKQITVFDLQGQKVFEKLNANGNDFFTSTIDLNQQIGIVKVTLMNGQVISKKVIF